MDSCKSSKLKNFFPDGFTESNKNDASPSGSEEDSFRSCWNVFSVILFSTPEHMGLNKKRISESSMGSLNALSIILEYKHEVANIASRIISKMAGRMSKLKEVLNQLGNACKKGDVEKLQNLFNEGSPEIYCNAVYKQIPLLTWAVKGDHIEVMDFLIENRADVRKFFSLFWFVLFCFFTRL